MTRHATLCLLAFALTASPAAAQQGGRAERPAASPKPPPTTSAPNRRTPDARTEPAAAAPARSSGGQAAAPAGEARSTGGRRQGGPPADARANRPGGAQAALLESFDDWTAYATPAGRGRICYALSQPTTRSPKTLNRDGAFLFVSIRPSENVRNEVAISMGFPVMEPAPAATASTEAAGRGTAAKPQPEKPAPETPSPDKPPPEQQLVVGGARFPIAGKDQNAWLADAAQEGSLVAVMARGQKLVVRAVSKRGSAATDEYSLKGFGDAWRKVREECR